MVFYARLCVYRTARSKGLVASRLQARQATDRDLFTGGSMHLHRLNRPVIVVITLVTAAAGAVTFMASTAHAAAPAVRAAHNSAARGADPAALNIMAQQDVTLAQAETRLSWQQRVPALNTALRRHLSAAKFGGTWIAPNNSDRVKVGVVGLDPRTRATITQALHAADLSAATDLVPVKYSLKQLVRADAWLAAQLDKLSSRGHGSPHLDASYRPDLNRVQLGVAGHNLTAAERALVAHVKARYGALVQVVAQAAGSATGTSLDCTDNLSIGQYCYPPLRGGIEIFSVNSQGQSQPGLCTGGFIASSRIDGKLYQFTAGHCAVEAPNGATNRWATAFPNLSGHVIGTVHHYIWGLSGDEAILNINNPGPAGWKLPQGWVAVMKGPNTTLNEEYPISSAQYSTLGARVCESGEAAGSICGIVTALGVSYCYGPQNQQCTKVNNLGEASFCAKPGDSGAPVFASHQAFGLVVALETDSLGDCYGTFYQGIKGASNAMNVNIVLAH